VAIALGAAAIVDPAALRIGAAAVLLAFGVFGFVKPLHVGAMVLVMGVVALLVYEKLGLEVLRRAWLNTDQLWAATFVMAAGLTLVT
jgi:hypothetical protein